MNEISSHAGELFSILQTQPGAPARSASPQSHFFERIDYTDGQLHGRSRRWGDASVDTQRRVIQGIEVEALRQGFSLAELSFSLAVARTESGFNPDAAAAKTSAVGVGQLLDATAENLRVSNDLRGQISGMIQLLKENLSWAAKKFKGRSAEEILSWAYARYHDGPSLKYGGRKIAEREVVPLAERIFQKLRELKV